MGWKKIFKVVGNGAVVHPTSSASHSQTVLKHGPVCVQDNLTGLMVNIFLNWSIVYCPLYNCGRSSMGFTGNSKLRNTTVGLSMKNKFYKH